MNSAPGLFLRRGIYRVYKSLYIRMRVFINIQKGMKRINENARRIIFYPEDVRISPIGGRKEESWLIG